MDVLFKGTNQDCAAERDVLRLAFRSKSQSLVEQAGCRLRRTLEGLCFGARRDAEEHESLKDDDDETEEQHAEEHEPIKCHRRRTLQDASPHASILGTPGQEAVGGFDQRVVNAVMSREARAVLLWHVPTSSRPKSSRDHSVCSKGARLFWSGGPCSDLSQ